MGKGMLVNSDNMQWLNKRPLKEWKEFPKFQKCGNNIWKPQNASASLETPEGQLVGILTEG